MASMFSSFRILLCIFAHLPQESFGFDCLGPVYPPQGLTYARIEPDISGRASQEYAKIRIKLFYHPSIDDKPYRGLVQEAADFWANALSVKPVDGRLFKSRDCESGNKTINNVKYCLGSCEDVTKCRDVEVRREHLDGCKHCTQKGESCTKDQPEPGTGVKNADLVFYVSGIESTTCSTLDLVAYAGPCEMEPVLDRPVFAHINICPQAAEKYDKKIMLRTIKHEMMHALGFGLFFHFRDKEGHPLWPRDKNGSHILTEEGFREQKVLNITDRQWPGEPINTIRGFLATEAVVREAQNHFGCDKLEGAELEDYGGSATKFKHFEARVFYDDAMRGDIATGKGLFSRIDFAVLEDSGWYQVNYSQAEDMEFGRNLGCDFCMESCKFWINQKRIEGKSPEPYCDSPDYANSQGIICIGPKKLFSGCPLTKLSPEFIRSLHDPNSTEPTNELPRKYQHFDKIFGGNYYEGGAQWGSMDPYADCCPVPLQNWDVTNQFVNVHCESQPNPAWNPNRPWNPYQPPTPYQPLNPPPYPYQPPNPHHPPYPYQPPYPYRPPNPHQPPYPYQPPFPYQPRNPHQPPYPYQPPFPYQPRNSYQSPNTYQPSNANQPRERNPATSPEPSRTPNPTLEPSEPNPTANPVEEAKADEYETNQSSNLYSSVLLVILVPLMVLML